MDGPDSVPYMIECMVYLGYLEFENALIISLKLILLVEKSHRLLNQVSFHRVFDVIELPNCWDCREVREMKLQRSLIVDMNCSELQCLRSLNILDSTRVQMHVWSKQYTFKVEVLFISISVVHV